jgi:AbrB family looped-hinge helix DNA binding protein
LSFSGQAGHSRYTPRACHLAKITSRGQITIPIDIRKRLGVKEGDKVIFIEDGSRIVVANAAKIAFADMRAAFDGDADRLGLKDEGDVVALVDEVREEMWKERYAGNA